MAWMLENVLVGLAVAAVVVLLLVRSRRDWFAAYAELAAGDPPAQAVAVPLRRARSHAVGLGVAMGVGLMLVVYVVATVLTVITFVAARPEASWSPSDLFGLMIVQAIVWVLKVPVAVLTSALGLVMIVATLVAHRAGRRILGHYDNAEDPAVTAAMARTRTGGARATVAALVVVGVILALGLGALTVVATWLAAGVILIPAPPGSKSM